MTAPERRAKVAEVVAGHEGYAWDLKAGGWVCRCGEPLTPAGSPASPELAQQPWREHVAAVTAPLLDEFQAEDEIAGQMKHITAEVVRGDVPLSDTEELIAALRARVSHAEAERDEAFRVAPGMGVAVYERGKRDGAARVREAVEAAFRGLAADLWQEAGRAGRRNSHTEAVNLRYAANRISTRLTDALDAAEKAAVEPASVPTSEREGGNGPDHSGKAESPSDRRTAAQERICGNVSPSGLHTCVLPAGHGESHNDGDDWRWGWAEPPNGERECSCDEPHPVSREWRECQFVPADAWIRCLNCKGLIRP